VESMGPEQRAQPARSGRDGRDRHGVALIVAG
jgi:hypothetical protein